MILDIGLTYDNKDLFMIYQVFNPSRNFISQFDTQILKIKYFGKNIVYCTFSIATTIDNKYLFMGYKGDL